jgi:hypothetical protein
VRSRIWREEFSRQRRIVSELVLTAFVQLCRRVVYPDGSLTLSSCRKTCPSCEPRVDGRSLRTIRLDLILTIPRSTAPSEAPLEPPRPSESTGGAERTRESWLGEGGQRSARERGLRSMVRFLLTRVKIDRQTSTFNSDLTPRKVGESHPRRPRSTPCLISSVRRLDGLTFQPQAKAFGSDNA